MTTQEKVNEIKSGIGSKYIEREGLIDSVFLSIFSGCDLLALGTPGTAKSAVIKSIMGQLTAKCLTKQLHPYSTEKDLLGDVNPSVLMDTGKRVHSVPGTILDSEIVFLDEVFKGTRGSRAALLEILSDRQFSENGETRDLPLLAVLSASNELPADKGDAAFYSRLQIRVLVEDLTGSKVRGDALWNHKPIKSELPKISAAEISAAREEIRKIEISDSAKEKALYFFDQIDELGIDSDQRKRNNFVGLNGSLAQAQAWLRGSMRVEVQDLCVAKMVFWNKPSERESLDSLVTEIFKPEVKPTFAEYGQTLEYAGLVDMEKCDKETLQTLIDMCRSARRPVNYCRLTIPMRNKIDDLSKQAHLTYLKRDTDQNWEISRGYTDKKGQPLEEKKSVDR